MNGANIVAGICVVIAGWLAIKGRVGWGWFLFVAVICVNSSLAFWKETK